MSNAGRNRRRVPNTDGRNRPVALPILLMLLALGAVSSGLLAAGCGKSPEIPIIAGSREYSDVLAKAEKLSAGPLERFEKAQSLTNADKKDLQEALRLFDGLIAFIPQNFGAYFGAAKIHEALGQPEAAFASMQKFIELAPPEPIDDVKRLLAEAHFDVGKSFEDRGEFELARRNAERAVKYFREHPDYLTLLASCRLREGKGDEAHALVDAALKLDPNHARARQLHTMMKPH